MSSAISTLNGLLTLKQEELSHGVDSANSADYFASGGCACMAVQSQLGLWTERRDWFDPRNRAHSIAAQSVLT